MVIGFRSFPDGFAYVVLEGTQSEPQVLGKDRLCLPEKQCWSARLAWVRKQLSEILLQFAPDAACVRTIEPIARKKSVKRLNIEAVIQEYLYSECSIDCKTRINSQLKRDISAFSGSARYLDRVLTQNDALVDLDSSKYKDAALAAISELPEE
jgi:hypothetical protein